MGTRRMASAVFDMGRDGAAAHPATVAAAMSVAIPRIAEEGTLFMGTNHSMNQ